MPMTAAERQRAYRQRKIADGTDSRLDVVVSAGAAAALQRLAAHHDMTQRAMLEQVLAQAEQSTVADLADPSGYYRVTG